jgi:transcriptional regulator with XRE-family HTH domain
MSSTSLLGEKIVDARRSKGMTQAELAELTGVSRASISLYESGNGHPSYKVLGKLSKALGVLFVQPEEVSGEMATVKHTTELSKNSGASTELQSQLMQEQVAIQEKHIEQLQEQVKRLEAQVDLLVRIMGDSRK